MASNKRIQAAGGSPSSSAIETVHRTRNHDLRPAFPLGTPSPRQGGFVLRAPALNLGFFMTPNAERQGAERKGAFRQLLKHSRERATLQESRHAMELESSLEEARSHILKDLDTNNIDQARMRVEKVVHHLKAQQHWSIVLECLRSLERPDCVEVLDYPSRRFVDMDRFHQECLAAVDVAYEAGSFEIDGGECLRLLAEALHGRFGKDLRDWAEPRCGASLKVMRKEATAWDYLQVARSVLGHLNFQDLDSGCRLEAVPQPLPAVPKHELKWRPQGAKELTSAQADLVKAILRKYATSLSKGMVEAVTAVVEREKQRKSFFQKRPVKKAVFALVEVVLGGGVLAFGIVTAQVLVIAGGALLILEGCVHGADAVLGTLPWLENAQGLTAVLMKAVENMGNNTPRLTK